MQLVLRRVQRHGLQVAASLPRVRGPVRGGEGALSAAVAERGRFYALTVAQVERLTDDSAAITFAVPPELRDVFAFRPGQSLTV